MEEKDVVQALSALAQPVRLRVFRALVGAGPQGTTPTALADDLAVPASSLSFHLKELAHAGPFPAAFILQGVVGKFPPKMEEQPVALATIILSPNNWVSNFK